MFGIGFSELIIIGIIALIAIGPDKLPELAAKAGRFIWDIRRAWEDVRDSVKTEMMTIKQPFDEIRQATQDARNTMRREADEFRASTEKSLSDAKTELRGAVEGKPAETPAPAAEPELAVAALPAIVEETPVVEAPPVEAPPVPAGPQPYKKQRAVPQSTIFFDLDGNPVPPPVQDT